MTPTRFARTKRFFVWLWDRLTFKRTREFLYALMTNHENDPVPLRAMSVLSFLSAQGFVFHHVVMQGKDFSMTDYSTGVSALLIAGGAGVWLSAKGGSES